MNTSELRLGNIVRTEGRIHVVTLIGKDFIFYNSPDFGHLSVKSDELFPENLTSEWLLKLGFNKDNNYY